MISKQGLKRALISVITLISLAMIAGAFVENNIILFFAAALILAGVIISNRPILLFPLLLGMGSLGLLLATNDLGLPESQRLALGASLAASGGYSLFYCWQVMIWPTGSSPKSITSSSPEQPTEEQSRST